MTTDTSPGRSQKQKGGPRRKHVPQRTCVACRQKDAKREYVRIVRTPEGEVRVDPTGKANGRGAYLHASRGCWDRALAGGALNNALKISLDQETKQQLAEYARSHFPPENEAS